jgi:hypothetical protein
VLCLVGAAVSVVALPGRIRPAVTETEEPLLEPVG